MKEFKALFMFYNSLYMFFYVSLNILPTSHDLIKINFITPPLILLFIFGYMFTVVYGE